MASYKNFQNDNAKHSKGINQLTKVKQVDKSTDNARKNKHMRLQVRKWTSFYRANIHRFVESYMGIELHLFQKIAMYFMNIHPIFMLVASRGISKSWMIAVFACAKCILYPGIKVAIASGVKKQASMIVTEKIQKELMMNSPNLCREIKDIKASNGDVSVVFHNGSSIVTTVSNDNARGHRAHLLILEEFRMIDESSLNEVLIPFLNVPRQPPYLKKKEYSHLIEETIEIYISSAYFTSNWMWRKMQNIRDNMFRGEDATIFSFDYMTAIAHQLMMPSMIKRKKKASDFDELAFSMEYENIMFQENKDAFFKSSEILKNRKIKKAFYPIRNEEYQAKKKKKKETLKDGEVRILGVDIALMGGDKNDASIVTCMRLIPNGDHYLKKVVYIEALPNGSHTDEQAIRIKQLFEDFQASKVILDTHGIGLSVYDSLVKIQYDEIRDVEYDAWTAYNNADMASRCKAKNPLPVIFSMKAGKEINHEVATGLRVGFQNKIIELLVDDAEGRELLSEKSFYRDQDVPGRVFYEMPFAQTSALQNELVTLDHEINGGFIKIKEKSTKRKDRYSSLAYCNYLAVQLEKDLVESNEYDEDDDIVYFFQ